MTDMPNLATLPVPATVGQVANTVPKPRQRQRRARRNHTGLTAAQRTGCESYLRELADVIGLTNWHFTLAWDVPAAEDCDAEIESIEGRYAAVVYLSKDFVKLSADEARRVLTHELLHCYWAPTRHFLCSGGAENMLAGTAAAAVVTAAHPQETSGTEQMSTAITMLAGTGAAAVAHAVKLQEEYAVDQLSTAMSRLMPLPTFLA